MKLEAGTVTAMRSIGKGVKYPARAVRAAAGCASLAMLSACAGGHHAQLADADNTQYYIDHAQGNYAPPGPPGDPWGPYIHIASQKFDVPEAWIRGVMRAESGGHEYMDGQLTVSSAGAMGLMQLEPGTYQEMAARYGLGSDPFNPYNNIMAGTAYIHEMYEVYGSPAFLAAYDAGPGRLDSYMNYHTPLPYETVNYVAEIAPSIQGYYPQDRSSADQLALNTLPAGDAPGLLPRGFVPEAPPPEAPDNPIAPVQMAAIVPQTRSETAVYTPQAAPAPEPAPATAGLQRSSVYTPPVQMAENTPPPPVEHVAIYQPPPPVQHAAIYQPPPPPPEERHNFSIIQPAYADTAPESMRNDEGQQYHSWAIQVGAYNSAATARAALGIAELSAVRELVKGHAEVVRVREAGRVRYRARVVGLPHDEAVNACDRLSGGPTGCAVLSPDGQS